MRVTLPKGLQETLGATCLLGKLLTGLQMNLDFTNLLWTLETDLFATSDFTGLLVTLRVTRNNTKVLCATKECTDL